MLDKFDVIVLGAGPGGYIAAIRAAQLGLKTAIIEKEHLGGVCLNWGCIPTKALLRSAEIYQLIKHASAFGIEVSSVKFNLNKIVERSRNVAATLSKGIKGLMKKNKVIVFDGHGEIISKGKVRVVDINKKEIVLNAPNIVIATGARARELSNIKPDGKYICTYKNAMIPQDLPEKLLIVGSGAIGIEFASFYNAFGCKVTIAETSTRILNAEDEEIVQIAQKSFEKKGILFKLKIQIKNAIVKNDQVEVRFIESGKEYVEVFDRVILAVGIVPNVENIGLNNTKVKIENGHIKTDEYMQTDELGIYAIGDVTAGPWLAHKASHEGVLCAEKIAGHKNAHPIKKENIPGCTYCSPQIASVGLTEAKAIEKGFKIRVGRFPYYANGKAIAMGETEGMIKTIFDEKTGELLGAHMIGAEVTEMIQGYVVGKALECTELDLMQTVFAHPTLSEMMHESVLDAYSKALNF